MRVSHAKDFFLSMQFGLEEEVDIETEEARPKTRRRNGGGGGEEERRRKAKRTFPTFLRSMPSIENSSPATGCGNTFLRCTATTAVVVVVVVVVGSVPASATPGDEA